jgi:putative membrane protein
MEASAQAYCGAPPVPGATAWNLDPFLIGTLVAGAACYAIAAARAGSGAPTTRQQAYFHAGWLIVGLALVSPLCNLSVALFSARVTQHMIVALVGAPLIVAGRGDAVLARALGWTRSVPRSADLALGPAAFALALWVWHLGPPYDATLRGTALYWLMHLTLFAAAISLWRAILFAPPLPSLAASFFTGLQMTALGALLTLSPHVWFHAHESTTWPWGLSPLEDQQLGGVIMWVPAGMLLLAHAVVLLGLAMLRQQQDHAAPSPAERL